MRKEQTLLMAQHIENTTFEHWWSVHGLYANNMVIDGLIKEEKDKEEKDKGKELALAAFSRTCNRCGCQGHKEAECYVKKHMNRQTLIPKNNSGGMGSNNDHNSKNHGKKKRFQGNCNYCRKFRHKEVDCRKKATEAKNGNQETASTAISDGNHVEFLLCAKTHDIGMVNKHAAKESVSIIMGNK